MAHDSKWEQRRDEQNASVHSCTQDSVDVQVRTVIQKADIIGPELCLQSLDLGSKSELLDQEPSKLQTHIHVGPTCMDATADLQRLISI